jgi:ribonucleotide reductase alpha subunit
VRRFVDQGVSLNLFFPAFVDAAYVLECHFLAWAGGSKSLYYVRSRAPKNAENVNTQVERINSSFPKLRSASPVKDNVLPRNAPPLDRSSAGR